VFGLGMGHGEFGNPSASTSAPRTCLGKRNADRRRGYKLTARLCFTRSAQSIFDDFLFFSFFFCFLPMTREEQEHAQKQEGDGGGATAPFHAYKEQGQRLRVRLGLDLFCCFPFLLSFPFFSTSSPMFAYVCLHPRRFVKSATLFGCSASQWQHLLPPDFPSITISVPFNFSCVYHWRSLRPCPTMPY
jgi:hypothetical protein